ncbi:hypothetical protein CLU96_1445 [Chryseobacterium sp. 52]|nr:hypothetical protein CLU96_1445 [Chryseobacterium sp. 52]
MNNITQLCHTQFILYFNVHKAKLSLYNDRSCRIKIKRANPRKDQPKTLTVYIDRIMMSYFQPPPKLL